VRRGARKDVRRDVKIGTRTADLAVLTVTERSMEIAVIPNIRTVIPMIVVIVKRLERGRENELMTETAMEIVVTRESPRRAAARILGIEARMSVAIGSETKTERTEKIVNEVALGIEALPESTNFIVSFVQQSIVYNFFCGIFLHCLD
jgi:hypothetical protein